MDTLKVVSPFLCLNSQRTLITFSAVEYELVQIRVDFELAALIDQAVQRTGLTRAKVLRQGLRKGVPEVMRAVTTRPKKTLVDALLDMKGLEIPERRCPLKRRL